MSDAAIPHAPVKCPCGGAAWFEPTESDPSVEVPVCEDCGEVVR